MEKSLSSILPRDGMGALVLAAGKGTRMHSRKPKVLHTFLGEPMLAHVLEAVEAVFGSSVWTLIGYEAAQIQKAFPERDAWLIQQEQRGTGHAVHMALPALKAAGVQRLLIVYGDVPCLDSALVKDFVEAAGDAPLAVATLQLDDAGSYGRIVRHNGVLQGIVEAKDYDEAQHGPVSKEINAGMYLCDMDILLNYIPRLTANNAAGEYYLTDLVRFLVEEGVGVCGVSCGSDRRLLGVNSPFELTCLESDVQAQKVDALRRSGVIMHGEGFRISPFANIEPGAELYAPCDILGKSTIATGVIIHPHVIIINSSIAEDTVIQAFSHLDGAIVETACIVGPYARLRPGTVMESTSHVGNFVEMKKARLGHGSKANHLSYLGDAEIGANTNIGAGTITCNYDGVNKHITRIGEGAFIGSNTSLVAPVNVGDGALIGAGSVITRDVPAKHLGLTRAQQKNSTRRE